MWLHVIVGIVGIGIGLALIAFGRPIGRAMRWGLERFYGKELADIVTDERRTRWATLVTGGFFVIGGIVSIWDGLFPW